MKIPSHRITSIDLLRGIVMMLMALDHVRDFFHNDAMIHDPMNLETTTPVLFFTRWVTHYCAPVFVFLSGMSAFLSGTRKTPAALSVFLFKRGLWLIFIEFSVISLGWSFDPLYHMFAFQVIWAIGISMVLLAALVRLPFAAIAAFAVITVCCHNLLDYPEAARNGQVGFWWDLIHHGGFNMYELVPGHSALIIYPFLPWTGIMALGYCFGRLYAPSFEAARRKKILIATGIAMVALFVVVRLINSYGDPAHWSMQGDFIFTLLSFLSVSKYPPSLLYICITIGPALIALALTEQVRNRFCKVVSVFGRVPFFYYILHVYLIHLLAVALFFASGYTMDDVLKEQTMFLFRPATMGFGLAGVYAAWVFVLFLLYWPCRWYDRYKQEHKHWWLSYL